jgi:hypothetical protein
LPLDGFNDHYRKIDILIQYKKLITNKIDKRIIGIKRVEYRYFSSFYKIKINSLFKIHKNSYEIDFFLHEIISSLGNRIIEEQSIKNFIRFDSYKIYTLKGTGIR